MSTGIIVLIIGVVIIFIFVNSKMSKRGDFYLIKTINTNPDAVFRWANSNEKCFVVTSPYGHLGVDKDKYIGPYKVTEPSLDGDTIKIFIERDYMELAIKNLKTHYS